MAHRVRRRNGETPDCGSLLPLVQGSLLPNASLWLTKLWRYRVGGAFTLRICPQRPTRQQGWLRRAAAGCRSPRLLPFQSQELCLDEIQN